MSATKNVKLYYFNARGRGELIRWLLAESGWSYEDKRIEGQEEWTELKGESPYGAMPWMDINGEILCETIAIANYVAQEAGLMGDCAAEAAQGTMMALMANECIEKMGQAFFQSDQSKKDEMLKKVYTEAIPKFFKFVLKTKGTNEWICGKKMTLADVSVAGLIDTFQDEGRVNTRKGMPEIMAIYDKVVACPKIKDWIAKRPQTPF